MNNMKRRGFLKTAMIAVPAGVAVVLLPCTSLASEAAKKANSEQQRLLKKWKPTGILRGLDYQEQIRMARRLEELCKDILVLTGGVWPMSDHQIKLVNILFPVQRRVKDWQVSIRNGWFLVDGRRFKKLTWLQKWLGLVTDLNAYNGLCVEAELCVIISDEMVHFADPEELQRRCDKIWAGSQRALGNIK